MSDNIVVVTSTDAITVVDPTTLALISITEDVVSVGSGPDQISIVPEIDVVSVTEPASQVAVTEVQEVISPLVNDVTIQIVEESSVPYAKRVDFVGETLIYKAEATVGSLEADSVWRIRRLTIDIVNEDDIKEEWANGDATFDKVWDDRLTLDYS